MIYDEALEIISKAYHNGRLPHAYLVVGDPRKEAMNFCNDVAMLLLCHNSENGKPCGTCPDCANVVARRHADVFSLEPESKSRQILIDRIREDLIPWASKCAYSGGWKIGVIWFVDRMNIFAANAFLKTLEEPADKTLFLLVTNNPGALLPTISSRCQTIDLSTGRIPPNNNLRLAVGEILSKHSLKNELISYATAAGFVELFDEIKEISEEEVKTERKLMDNTASSEVVKAWVSARTKEMRKDVYIAIKEWYRDLLLLAASPNDGHELFFPEFEDSLREKAKRVNERTLLQCLTDVDSLVSQIEERNMRPDLVFPYWFGRLR